MNVEHNLVITFIYSLFMHAISFSHVAQIIEIFPGDTETGRESDGQRKV